MEEDLDYKKILEEILQEIQPLFGEGKVADYIPALAEVDPKHFAMSITLTDGRAFHIGDYQTKFSIQSISKVFTLALAINIYGKEILNRLWLEPSGNSFNSLVRLEQERGIPRNPFVNSGAIVVADMLYSRYKDEAFTKIMHFIENTLDYDNKLTYSKSVFDSELKSGYTNFALINMMKSFGNIHNPTYEVMKTYFKHCSVRMTTEELSKSMLFLANDGVSPLNKKQFLTEQEAKRVNAVMLTCGHYDASGDFAYRVGLPGKSGVGGGIIAVVPDKMTISVWSPELNKNGNSLIGTQALELFTSKTGLSIF